jgi:hypothetical protein
MRLTRTRRLRATLVLAATAALMLTAAASAGQVSRETIHEEDTLVLDDFCEVEGLSVELSFVLDLRVHAVPHGRDRLVYFLSHGRQTEVITNLANDRFVTTAAKVIEKDLRVTNNGDGTLTILILATGNATVYGQNGKAIARNPGQTRFELVVDHGGTPNDPADDEELSFRIVKDSTGRSDDFCGAVVPALG